MSIPPVIASVGPRPVREAPGGDAATHARTARGTFGPLPDCVRATKHTAARSPHEMRVGFTTRTAAPDFIRATIPCRQVSDL